MMSSRRNRQGSAVVEFSLSIPLLGLLLAGAFRLGYAMYLYYALLTSVTGAGRFAARVAFDEPDHAFVSKVQNMAVYGSPAGGGQPLVSGLAPANIDVTWTKDAKGVPLTLTVAVKDFTAHALFQNFTWTGKPSITVRYAGAYKS